MKEEDKREMDRKINQLDNALQIFVQINKQKKKFSKIRKKFIFVLIIAC